MLASGLRIVIPRRQTTNRRSLRAPVYGLERTSHWTHRGNPGRVQFSPYALLCSRRCGREWGLGITGQHATGERAVSKGRLRAARVPALFRYERQQTIVKKSPAEEQNNACSHYLEWKILSILRIWRTLKRVLPSRRENFTLNRHCPVASLSNFKSDLTGSNCFQGTELYAQVWLKYMWEYVKDPWRKIWQNLANMQKLWSEQSRTCTTHNEESQSNWPRNDNDNKAMEQKHHDCILSSPRRLTKMQYADNI